MKGLKFIALCTVAMLTLSGCRKSDEKILEDDVAIIQEYLRDNNLTAESTDTGLHYVITEEGNNTHPDLFSEITVDYIGFFPNGEIFDQNTNITFPLLNVIRGWQEGFPFFSEGAEGLLLIPSSLGYGRNGNGSIGPDEVLIFSVRLIEVD